MSWSLRLSELTPLDSRLVIKEEESGNLNGRLRRLPKPGLADTKTLPRDTVPVPGGSDLVQCRERLEVVFYLWIVFFNPTLFSLTVSPRDHYPPLAFLWVGRCHCI